MRRAVLLFALAVPLAACGGSARGNHATSAPPSLAEAATKSASAPTVKIALEMTMTTSQLPQSLSMDATGVEDNAKHRVDMAGMRDRVAQHRARSFRAGDARGRQQRQHGEAEGEGEPAH